MNYRILLLLPLSLILIRPGFAQELKGTIHGKVIDEVTGEVLPGVNIVIVGTTKGIASDIEGKFVLANLKNGTYQVQASSVGYSSVIISDVVVNSARPATILFKLNELPIELQGLTVRSDFFRVNPSEIGSIANFSYEEIRRAPGGFEDVVRALSILPGVAQASAGRNDLVVRGGAPSENLFVVDGLVVPNINHFGTQGATGGPISFINLDFVRETTFSTGGFSSAYGDKLSSVLSIDLREGRSDRIGGKGTISASEFGFNLEGPVSSESNFIFSARRSYLDFIFNAAGFNFIPEYYDLFSKWTYNINSNNRLSYLFIGAFDNVKFNNKTSDDRYENSRILGSKQNTYVTGVSFRHLFDHGFFTLSLSRNFTDYDSAQRDTLFNPIFLNVSREGQNELKGDLVYKTSKTAEINFGISVSLIKFSTDIKLPSFVTSFNDTLRIDALTAQENFFKSSLYVQYSDLLFDKLRLSFGLRGDYFDEIKSKFFVSPRISLSYLLNEYSNLNLSTGIYRQSPSYIWLTANESNRNLEPVQVNQYILGYEHKLQEDLRIKVEGFYKDYTNYPASTLRPYLVLSNTGGGYGGSDDNFAAFGLDPLVSSGKGNIKGVELSMQKKTSDTPEYGILSVTWSQSFFTALDGIERPGSYDQNWIVNLTGGYIFNNKWEASFKFRFASGNPYTPFNNNGTQSVQNFNSKRFKSVHSLDIRVDRRWDFNGWNLVTYLDIQNIYNNKNTNTIRWDYRKNQVDDQSSIGLLPSIGVSVEF
jgi:hypothetical protein